MGTTSRAEPLTRQPLRTCIGCRTTQPASAMWRCALASNSEVVALSLTAPGRGAWVCSPACFDTAVHRKRFPRAWRRPVPDGALDELRTALTIAFESHPLK